MFELAAAVDVPADLLDALAWPPDVGAVYQHPDVSAWRAWIWAAVASGEEYEMGPPDVPSLETRGVVRLGVSSPPPVAAPVLDDVDILMGESEVVLAVEPGAITRLPPFSPGGEKKLIL